MKYYRIWDKVLSFELPKELIFKEQNPFNEARPKQLKLFEKKRWSNTYILPRTFGIEKETKDSIQLPDFLRPKQKEAVEKLLKYNYWLLLSGVGSGKSYMMAAIAKVYSWHTLVIAPKTEIAKWLYEKFKWLWIEVEIFNKDKFSRTNPPKVLIIVSRSFDMYWEKLSLDSIYKQVLIDEIHMQFTTRNRIHFFCQYKYDKVYWFTWTPELNNFPSEALFKMFNNVYIDSWIRPKNPEVYYYKFSKSYNAVDWQDLVDTMYWDTERLAHFLFLVEDVMKRWDRNMWIIFVDRTDIAEWIAVALNKLWISAAAYTWKVSKKKREEILKELTEKKWVMVATYQSVGTWFDHPPLDTAFYFMFVKFKAQVKQAIGRILRGSENPEYYDFQDGNLYSQVRERMKAYKEMWWDIEIKKYKNYLIDIEKSIQLKSLAEEIKNQYKKKEDIKELFNI